MSGNKIAVQEKIPCRHCKKFSGYTNSDVRKMPSKNITIYLNCVNCGKPAIKILSTNPNFEKKMKLQTLEKVQL